MPSICHQDITLYPSVLLYTEPFMLYPRHELWHGCSQSGTAWMSQPLANSAYACRMLGALCVSWWTCLNRMLPLTNGVMKNQPTLFQCTWKTHIKEEVREEGRKKDKTDAENGRQKRDNKVKKDRLTWVHTLARFRGDSLTMQIQKIQKHNNESRKMAKNTEWKQRRRKNEWKTERKNRSKSNRRQERLGDIFSSSLVRDVLYSAGWSLRWGPLEIIMTACCFRQPHTFHWKTIYKLPLLSPSLM